MKSTSHRTVGAEASMPEQTFSIGDVAARSGMAPSAIRYYERTGLLPAARRMAGKRAYDESVFRYLALLQLARDAGFSLGETKQLLHGFASPTPARDQWRPLAQSKLAELDEQVERIRQMQVVLDRL